jgi:hypothetical protein
VKIPNSDRAIIEQSKITGYLLNIEHERGGSKAKKLSDFGRLVWIPLYIQMSFYCEIFPKKVCTLEILEQSLNFTTLLDWSVATASNFLI